MDIMKYAHEIVETVLETRHLRLVLAIAETGSVTRAGDRLHLTQSAVSHQLAELESRLGLQLFARVRKRLVITPAGERLLETSRRILDDLAQAELQVRGEAGSVRWQLRVSTECYTCYHWLPPALRVFQEHHPDADVRIVLDATRRPLPALLRREIELAIVASDVVASELEAVPLFDDEIVAIVPPGHRMARRRSVEGSDLAEETVFTYDVSSPESAWFRRAVLGGVVPREVKYVPITEALVELVRAGLGVGIVHRWIVAPELRRGALRACRLGRGGVRRHWKGVFARTSPHRAALLDLLRLVRRGRTGEPGARPRTRCA